jgi:hypothetical protein
MCKRTDEEIMSVVKLYKDFLSAGEPKPAVETAKELKVSTRNIHNVLKIARRRGFLPTLGQGKTWSLETWEWNNG